MCLDKLKTFCQGQSILLTHSLFPCSVTQACIATIVSVQEQHGIDSTSLLNFVVSDGEALIATRFVSPATDKAASLYYAEGVLAWSRRLSAVCDCFILLQGCASCDKILGLNSSVVSS